MGDLIDNGLLPSSSSSSSSSLLSSSHHRRPLVSLSMQKVRAAHIAGSDGSYETSFTLGGLDVRDGATPHTLFPHVVRPLLLRTTNNNNNDDDDDDDDDIENSKVKSS